jgi:hypothetical protein
MDLHCGLTNAQSRGDLFARVAAHDLDHNFTLSEAWSFEASADVSQRRLIFAPGAVPFEA